MVPVLVILAGGARLTAQITLTGDVTGSGTTSVPATVQLVGGSTAANINAATVLANGATSANAVNSIVRRDASGNFVAGSITSNGTVTVTNSGSSGSYSSFGPSVNAFQAPSNADFYFGTVYNTDTGSTHIRTVAVAHEVDGATASSGAGAGFFAGSATGSNSTMDLTGTLLGGGLVAARIRTTHNGTGTVTFSSAITGQVSSAGMGAITDSAVFNAESPGMSSGTTWNSQSGLWVRGGAVSGTIATRYGVRVDTLTGGSSTYGVYVQSDPSYFGGNVGIGVAAPQSKLAVNGKISATEVVVTASPADYVFEPDYRLAPLSETAEYIKTNHHLPGIPAGKTVEENGISLGEMQSKLLAKIEELTLHAVEADRRIRLLEEKNRELSEEVEKRR